jgi:hypothetical protein
MTPRGVLLEALDEPEPLLLEMRVEVEGRAAGHRGHQAATQLVGEAVEVHAQAYAHRTLDAGTGPEDQGQAALIGEGTGESTCLCGGQQGHGPVEVGLAAAIGSDQDIDPAQPQPDVPDGAIAGDVQGG